MKIIEKPCGFLFKSYFYFE